MQNTPKDTILCMDVPFGVAKPVVKILTFFTPKTADFGADFGLFLAENHLMIRLSPTLGVCRVEVGATRAPKISPANSTGRLDFLRERIWSVMTDTGMGIPVFYP